jgi:large subunit ribosomal protein L24
MQSTKNPRKQRKRLFNAPAHMRHKLMAAPLSPELFAQKGVKALPVRKGDAVRVTRGDHKGFDGKVSRVDLKHYRVFLEGLTREKVDGKTVFVALHPSKIMIRTLNLDDKVRKAVLERKKPIIKKDEKATKVAKKATKAKPVEEVAETNLPEEVEEQFEIEEEDSSQQSTAESTSASKAEGGT